jgi:hypothetical protein
MRDETIVTVINKTDEAGKGAKKDSCLVVIYGAELGRKYHIDGREMTIGRGTLNDICVSAGLGVADPRDAAGRGRGRKN